MPVFKKFTGTYPQVIDSIGLPSDFYAPNNSRDIYRIQVAQDLPRSQYVNYNGSVDSIKQQLADNSHLKDEELSFIQGNFSGGVFTEIAILTHPIFNQRIEQVGEENTQENFNRSLSFTYMDDERHTCGFSITYLRDDSDQSIPVGQRPLPFTVAVIKNVNKAPADREVIYYTHTALLPAGAVGGQDLEASNLFKELEKAINCQSVNQLLTGIINQDSIALIPFLELDSRLICNRNIDDRDTKLDKLFDLLVIWIRLAADPKQSQEKNRLMQELNTIINTAYHDINYFKNKSIEDVEMIVASYRKSPLVFSLPSIKNTDVIKQSLRQIVEDYQVNVTALKAELNKNLEKHVSENSYLYTLEIKTKLEQSFLRHNLGNIALIGFTLLAVVSIVLTLTGIFAPVGWTIGTGLGIALVITGGCAAILAACSVAKIASDESNNSFSSCKP